MGQEVPQHLLDSIYDAAADDRHWPQVLARIADLVSAEGAVLFGLSIADGVVYYDHTARLDTERHKVFAERHIRNVWSQTMVRAPVGTLVTSDEIVPVSDLVRTEFWHDVLRPGNLAHNAMSALANTAGFQGAFNVIRTRAQGPFGDGERDVLTSLIPHLRRALQLRLRVGAFEALRAAEFAVLECLTAAVVVLDQGGTVLFANRSARALHEAGGPIHLRNGTVAAAHPQENAALAALLRQMAQGRAGGALSLTHPLHPAPQVALLAPLRGHLVDVLSEGGLRRPAAVLIVTPPPTVRIDPGVMARAFAFTAAEGKVAVELAAGHSYAEAARTLGISVNTVKTHTRHILAKAGVGRQSEFIALAAAMRLVDVKPAE